jgi:[acyl-carrier-protein] S-malonyltransferase
MAAIIAMDVEALQEVCREAEDLAGQSTDDTNRTDHPGRGRVIIANFNAPGQIVISGEQKALNLAMELAKARGAKRVIPLSVSGAFHSPVMQPATSELARAIAAAPVQNASIPIISNIHASPLTEAQMIREELAQQIATPVEWTRSIEYLAGAGVTIFIEIGPGQALTGMVKRIIKGVTTINISNATDIEKAVSSIREMGPLREI